MKSFFLAIAVMLLAGHALADTKAKAPADTVVQDGVTLVVDGDNSWQDADKLAWNDPQRAVAVAVAKAFVAASKKAQAENKAGDYEKAEADAPTYQMKAFYGLNHLRQLMGGNLGEGGSWSDYDMDEKGAYNGDQADLIKAEYARVQGWVTAAIATTKTRDTKGNDVKTVQGYLDHYKAGALAGVLK